MNRERTAWSIANSADDNYAHQAGFRKGMLSLPARLVAQLGLRSQSTRRISSSIGPAEATVYDAVRLTIQGRFCTMDVLEVPDDVPVLIGQLPLEALDFVVDPLGRRLIGNPAHGGVHTCELY